MSPAASLRARLLGLVAGLVACDGDPAPPGYGTHVDDWRDEVIYQVVVDRFANGDPTNDEQNGIGPVPGDLARHQGGDWAGLRERLDYVQALGATTLWISPVVENVDRAGAEDGYHGYWASDFTQPNPRFGSLEELQALVGDAHARGMKVIVDVVVNHAGRVFDYDLDGDGVADPNEAGPLYQPVAYEAPLLWTHRPSLFDDRGVSFRLEASDFRRRGVGVSGEGRIYGDFPTGLRDLRTDDERILAALVSTYAWWVERTDVDGFRLDAVPHVEESFWPEFGARLRARLAASGKHRFFLFGETFDGSLAAQARTTDDAGDLDSFLDFPLKLRLVDGVILDGNAAASAREVLEGRSAFRPFEQPGGIGLDPWSARVTFADNHDTWRLRGDLDSFPAARLALLVALTVDGIPCVYYGTEQELRGQGGGRSREPLWETGYRRDTPTWQWITHLLALRRELAALSDGDLTVRFASEEDGFSDAPDAGLLAYERRDGEGRALVVLNAHALKRSQATVPTGFTRGTSLRDRLGGGGTLRVDESGAVDVDLGPREALLLTE